MSSFGHGRFFSALHLDWTLCSALGGNVYPESLPVVHGSAVWAIFSGDFWVGKLVLRQAGEAVESLLIALE